MIAFVTWYPSCRRSDALARWLGGRSHLIHFLRFKHPAHAPVKYVLQAIATFVRLCRERPQVVFVASPPVVAVATVWVYARLFRVPFVVDAHTGVFDDPRWTWLTPVTRFLSRQALATCVTDEALAARVREWGGRTLLIADVPVEFPPVQPAALGPGFHVVVINTFSQDEPVGAVLEAARLVPDVHFHITGDARHARTRWDAALPPNARFTGWLSDEAYAALLKAADVIVTLTTHDHTMQRGGYEAMALGKPLITSNWPLLQATFCRGTVHVDNTASGLAAAVGKARASNALFAGEMVHLRRERIQAFRDVTNRVRELIQGAHTS